MVARRVVAPLPRHASYSHDRVEADRQTGRKLAHLREGEQDARDEDLPGRRVVPDGERLPRPAEDDLLVSDEAGQADRMDRRVPCPSARRSPSPCPRAHPASPRGAARRSRPGGTTFAASSANRIIRIAPCEKFGAWKHATPASRAARSIARMSNPVVPMTTGTLTARHRATFAATASGAVKSTAASQPSRSSELPATTSWPAASSAGASTDPTFPPDPKSAIFTPLRRAPGSHARRLRGTGPRRDRYRLPRAARPPTARPREQRSRAPSPIRGGRRSPPPRATAYP